MTGYNNIETLPCLKVKGHSGCKLEILDNKGRCIVKKYSSGFDYNERLKNQMHKQNEFMHITRNFKGFSSAEIIDCGFNDEDNLWWFSMEYVGGQKATEYFAKIDINTLNSIADNYIDYFKKRIIESQVVSPPTHIFIDKIRDLKSKLESIEFLEKKSKQQLIEYLMESIPSEDIYIGDCHGDFSLTNQLYSEDKIYLLDFLDTFIDSPLIDISKFRQDTGIGRIFQIDVDEESKLGRAYISLSYLDERVEQLIKSDYILSAWYPYFQVLNLTRILPYTTQKKELKFLEKNIFNIIKT